MGLNILAHERDGSSAKEIACNPVMRKTMEWDLRFTLETDTTASFAPVNFKTKEVPPESILYRSHRSRAQQSYQIPFWLLCEVFLWRRRILRSPEIIQR